jgi:hypothetical protein
MVSNWFSIDDDDLSKVDKAADFLQREFCPPGADPMWSAEYFRWKLGAANPAGKGYISLAMLEDRVIGTLSLTKKRLIINGNECIGAEWGEGYSSAVIRHSVQPINLSPNDPDPDSYINKSIFGRLASVIRRRAEADGLFIIYGTPNSNAYPGWVNKLGHFDFSEYWNQSFSRPTSGFIAHKYPSLSFLSIVLRNIEKSSIALQKTIYSKVLCKNLDFQINIPSDNELDELWTRLKPGKGFSLVRDASYWRYRYMIHPIAKYNFFAIQEKGHLIGVAVTRLYSGAGGKRIVAVAEWMIEERIPFGYVLSMIMNHYRDSDAAMFILWAGKFIREGRAAVRCLFFPRRRVPIIIADTPHGRLLHDMSDNIKFYLGSSDNI